MKIKVIVDAKDEQEVIDFLSSGDWVLTKKKVCGKHEDKLKISFVKNVVNLSKINYIGDIEK